MSRLNIQWIKVSGCVLLLAVLTSAQQNATSAQELTSRNITSLSIKGRSLSAADANSLEQALLKNPSDLTSRFTLISYYFAHFADKDAKTKRCGHVLWTIENLSDSELLHHFPPARLNSHEQCYEQGKELWLRNLDASKGNLDVLRNAVDYFMISDNALAEKLLRQGAAADPQNFKWRTDLGQLFRLQINVEKNPERRKELALKAIEEFELALSLKSGSVEQRSVRMNLTRMEFEAGNLTKAEALANQALLEDDDTWLRGDELHNAHTTLGLIALRNGNIAEAKRRLMLSAEVEGSPVLNSFGPGMALAKGLLEKGETQVVIEYLAQCGTFWNDKRVSEWVATIRDGRVPNFGVNGSR